MSVNSSTRASADHFGPGPLLRLPDKVTIRLEAGDVLRMLTPGGGGWGSAHQSTDS
jgi:N-methylhydantoinase B/oxoprolinase/acetone carboxylase alpha subunit